MDHRNFAIREDYSMEEEHFAKQWIIVSIVLFDTPMPIGGEWWSNFNEDFFTVGGMRKFIVGIDDFSNESGVILEMWERVENQERNRVTELETAEKIIQWFIA